MQRNLFWEGAQRSREYQRDEYYSTLDVLDSLDSTNSKLDDIRNVAISNHRNHELELFSAVDGFAAELGTQTNILLDISWKLDGISDELYSIRQTLEVGFETLALKLDITNSYLGMMTDLIANPVRTQAEEYARRGLQSLKNGWFEEALDDFQKVVELDRLHYMSWYNIGIIRAEKMGDEPGALESFALASKYSKPSDAFFYSSSLYQIAQIHDKNDNIALAKEFAEAAFKADRKNIPSAYLLAEIAAGAKEAEQSIAYLRVCELADPLYYLKALASTRLAQQKETRQFYQQQLKNLSEFNLATQEIVKNSLSTINDQDQGSSLDLEKLEESDKYLNKSVSKSDYLVQRTAHDKVNIFLNEFTEYAKKRTHNQENTLKRETERNEDRKPEFRVGGNKDDEIIGLLGGVLFGLAAFVYGAYYVTDGWESLGWLILYVPFGGPITFGVGWKLGTFFIGIFVGHDRYNKDAEAYKNKKGEIQEEESFVQNLIKVSGWIENRSFYKI